MNQVEASLKTSVVDKSTTMNGLLDSGASHAMREATEEEYQKGHPVSVTLAGEDVRLLRQNLQDLGCSLRWKKGSLQLYHPKRGMMKVNLVNNCPELQVRDALALIQELEAKHIKLLNDQVETLSARLEVMKKEVQRPWDELLKEYAATGNQATLFKVIHTCPVTKDLPEDVKAMLIEGFDVNSGERYLKDLPLTRRKRRALMVHSQWAVNINSGEDKGGTDPFEMIAKGGKILLNIDFKNSKLWDVGKREGVYRMLLWAASQGKISDVISAPQHSTWPTSRKNHRDPGLYDFRTRKEPYGRQELPPLQQLRVNKETADCVKPMLIWMLAMIKGPGDVGFAMCFPADEMVIRSADSPRASFWQSELWRSFRSVTSMKKTSFNMGAYGHRSQNPLSIATNYQDLISLNGVYDYDQSCVPPSLLSQEEMNTWSNGFKTLVAKAILSDYHEFANLYSENDSCVKIGKLTKEQEDQWRNHLLNDHQPYRADCSVCINAQATGLAGPFKQPGRDMDHEDYKYILVAAYRKVPMMLWKRNQNYYLEAKTNPVLKVKTENFVVPRRPSGQQYGGAWDQVGQKPFQIARGRRDRQLRLAMRWKGGWYRGPTVDVKRGHLIMREDGGLTVAKSVKFNVITQLYDLLETRGDSDRRISKKTRMTSWYTGAFVHGGVAGVRANLKDFPNTSKYLVNVAKHYAGEVNFSAVGIARNAQLGLHRDVHNYAKAKNYVMPLCGFEGGGLWVQDDMVCDEESTTKISPNGKEIKGKILKATEGEVMSFSPRLWHQVQPWEGTRTVMLMYTPRATRLSAAHVEQLEEAGFNVDKESLIKGDNGSSDEEEDQELVQMKTFLKDNELPQPAVFEEMEPSEMFDHHDEPQVNMKKMIRKAEVQYTPNVEEILRECERQGKQLDVTHTVSLGDVKKNLDNWRNSALKEFHNLTEVKRAFTVKKKSESPPGCRIVPCKGVYTTKPDKGPQGYSFRDEFRS
ncbi:GIP [Symbiodinium sp. CCMP2592]|nr:GIP [Symbiodinium sp. CCMP2592]